MPTYPAPICLFCKRYDQTNETGNTCEAFPAGIPESILISSVDHREPVQGDNGLRFEPVDKKAQEYAVMLLG